jgi:hypothetical protein
MTGAKTTAAQKKMIDYLAGQKPRLAEVHKMIKSYKRPPQREKRSSSSKKKQQQQHITKDVASRSRPLHLSVYYGKGRRRRK